MNKIIFGDCVRTMKRLHNEGVKVQTCITSPPYYGLRDYGTGTWIGGDIDCSHKRDSKYSDKTITGHSNKDLTVGDAIYKSNCPKCGAVREDLQVGLEETPKEYVDKLVEVFSCVWDILADDGTLWLNLGDSYAGSNGNGQHEQSFGQSKFINFESPTSGNKSGIRPKNLIGIPWRVAFALQDFGWNLRQDIIWHKPNPMPESVKDRCTKAHEYIFLLTKNPQYYFDNESIKEPVKEVSIQRAESSWNPTKLNISVKGPQNESFEKMGDRWVKEKANKRSVWTIPTRSYTGAHFATFPTDLIEPMVLAGSRVGDIVFDPFMGSGTTAQVAQHLGRKYLGCELNLDYKKLQDERLLQTSFELW
jgi:DNA modification methylase